MSAVDLLCKSQHSPLALNRLIFKSKGILGFQLQGSQVEVVFHFTFGPVTLSISTEMPDQMVGNNISFISLFKHLH